MATLDNSIMKADLVEAQNIQFVANFTHETDRLNEILGIFGPEVIQAGTTLYQYKVTGTLSAESVAEGDETPLSKYSVTKEPFGEFTIKPYRKLVTAPAILKAGVENAVSKTDKAMITDIRAGIWADFFTALKTGTGTAEGETLQAAIAQADATLGDALEKNHDAASDFVWFMNRFDVADYLAEHSVTLESAFGLTYLEAFLGVSNVFLTSSVEKGTFYVTPASNVHLYGVDFAALAQGGLTYETLDSNLIGVQHAPNLARTSCETFALVGATYIPEVKDYIVKGTVSPSEAV